MWFAMISTVVLSLFILADIVMNQCVRIIRSRKKPGTKPVALPEASVPKHPEPKIAPRSIFKRTQYKQTEKAEMNFEF